MTFWLAEAVRVIGNPGPSIRSNLSSVTEHAIGERPFLRMQPRWILSSLYVLACQVVVPKVIQVSVVVSLVVISPDVILCGWLGLKQQLTN